MILAIDYGRKHLGLAIGDKKLKIAFPYQTIENRSFGSVLNQIKAICQREKIKMIIIGRPVGMAGQKTKQTRLTDQFVTKLKRQINTQIEVEDERLTSQAAERFSTSAEHGHATAAMIILQNYLDKIRTHSLRSQNLVFGKEEDIFRK